MKRLNLLFLMLLLALGVKGQVQNVDSLENVLKAQGLTPAKEMECYQELFKSLAHSDSDKAGIYAERGLLLAKKEGDKLMASRFSQYMASMYQKKLAYDTALIYLNEALDLAVQVKDKHEEASVYSRFGVLYARQTEHKLALEYFTKSLSLLEGTDDLSLYLDVTTYIGSLQCRVGNVSQAIETLEQALEIAQKLNSPEAKLGVYYQLSVIYNGEGKVEKALEYQQEVIDISRSINDKIFEIAGMDAMAVTYLYGIKDYDKALTYAEKCLSLAKEHGDPMILAGIWKLLSNIYRYQRNYKDCADAALNSWYIDSTDLDIGANLAYNIAFSNAIMGNVEEAEYFLTQYSIMNQKKQDKAYREALVEVEVKYETEKKEQQIATLEKEKELYTWLGVGGGLLALALGGALWQTIRSTRRQQQLIATRSVMDGEMKERTRLARDLHDRLGGNLSAVKLGLSSTEPRQHVSEQLDSCIEEVRRVAHNLMPSSLQHGIRVALEDFAAQLPGVHFHFFGEDRRMDDRVEFALYCCASELVSNSLRHSGAARINLQLVQHGKYVTLTVQDDGVGYDQKAAGTGLGLKNIRDRVASCHGRMDVTSSPGRGTETIIELKVGKYKSS